MRAFIACVRMNLPSNSNVLPDPNLPQINDSSPIGKSSDTSTSENLRLGVDTVEDAELPVPDLSCGQDIVAFLIMIGRGVMSKGLTAPTSAALRYFSIRRRETKPYPDRKQIR